MRIFLGAFGDAGHAFPMLALGTELVASGHDVALQTWTQWERPVAAAGMTFFPAPEYAVFPTPQRPLTPYQAAVRAAHETVPQIKAFAPDRAVADILTPAPALAAELCGVPWASLIPHVHPEIPSGRPPFSIGARPPRTRLGATLWRRTDGLVARGLELGRTQYNACRAQLGLAPVAHVHSGLSRELVLVATLPALEPPRGWPTSTHVIGPLLWEPPGETVRPPPGAGPVILVAPSTAQDPDRALLRATLAGLAREPVRVIATYNGRRPDPSIAVPDNATLVSWLSYAKTMPDCDLVVCHGGHGTLVRALTSGCPVVVCPAGGDMAENAARVAWAGVGVRLPRRFLTPASVRWAVREALGDHALRARVTQLGTAWAASASQAKAANAIAGWASSRPAA